MSACVSPPQESVAHIREVAAIMAQAASTALPPFWKTIAPAVAARGFPVIAIQWRPCSAGFCVRCPREPVGADTATSIADNRTMNSLLAGRISPSIQCAAERGGSPTVREGVRKSEVRTLKAELKGGCLQFRVLRSAF